MRMGPLGENNGLHCLENMICVRLDMKPKWYENMEDGICRHRA